MQRLVLIILLCLCCLTAWPQVPDGPGGVGNTWGTSTLRLWLRPEMGVTLTSGVVSAWADQSGYGNNLSSPAGFRPVAATSSTMNGQTIMRYSGAQYFSSSLTGPGVNNITLFLSCNGSSYQSLFRFQNNSGTYLVYPWELGGTPRVFISSSDGGTGSGVASGLVSNVNNVGAARYRRNTTSGMQTFLNGGVNAQRNSVNTVLPSQPFFSGRYNPGSSEYPNCDVGDLIFFYEALNDVQMILIQNYLAAKYNVSLTSNDLYTMDDPANGDFDFDVAGIGRISGSVIHDDAQGTGMIRILNPSGLGNGDYYLWGHDNGTLGPTTADSPTGQGVQSRLVRVWRGSEVGTITDFDVRFDLTGFGPVTASHLRLLIDTDNDGSFADETTAGGGIISGATLVSGNIYQFANVSGLNNAIRFTLGTSNSVSTPLPIELLEFSAKKAGDQVKLNWTTARENNNDYFEIERSTDGLNFNPILKERTKTKDGHSSAHLEYTAIDNQPTEGTLYYRLKQVDRDGSSRTYQLVAVRYDVSENRIVIFPNPSRGEFDIDLPGVVSRNGVHVTIFSQNNKVVYQSPYKLQAVENKVRVKMREQPSTGTYLCLVEADDGLHRVKIVIE